MALLEVIDVSKYFGGLAAVDHVKINVDAGEFVGLIGPNGSGKTTLFNLITGFHHPSRGKVIYKGEEISRLSPNQIAAMGLVRTFQLTTLYSGWTVLENLMVAHHLRAKAKFIDGLFDTSSAKADEKKCLDAAEETMGLLGISEFRNSLVNILPYGLQKVVGIALAVMTRPETLLLDEPVAGASPMEIAPILKAIEVVRQRNVTIVMIEHTMRVVMGTCERVIVMNSGSVIADGTPEEVAKDENVMRAYLGDAHATIDY